MATGKIPRFVDPGRVKRMVAVRYALFFFALAVIFFLPAGTLDYWQAWVYMAILLLPMGIALLHYLEKGPELLELRMRTREKERKRRAIMLLFYPLFLAAFLLPGLDRRYGWSAVPAWLVGDADCIVLASYFLFIRVMHENRFLSRTVELVPGQKVIDTGPYAVVRHPMYAAAIPLVLFSPLALGSYWAILPAALLPLVIIARMFQEEKVLGRELPGYRKYARRVKHRLIPGVW